MTMEQTWSLFIYTANSFVSSLSHTYSRDKIYSKLNNIYGIINVFNLSILVISFIYFKDEFSSR
jgi:amino acid permease